MDIKFRPDNTLVIVPENSVEAMALKYWAQEYRNHGDKVLDVETEVPDHTRE